MASTKGDSEIPGVLEREICQKTKGDEAMATKSNLISGMGIALSLVQGLVEAVKKVGGSDDDLHRLVTEEGKPTLAKIAGLIAGIVRQTFRVVVDYSRDLAQMIADGAYDYVNSDITADHFPIKGEGKQEREIELFHFNRTISSDDAIKEMAAAGYRPAFIEELLAFGQAQPELQRQFPIVALGSVWRSPDGYRYIPCLRRCDAGRGLCLGSFGPDWRGSFRFAAVRNA